MGAAACGDFAMNVEASKVYPSAPPAVNGLRRQLHALRRRTRAVALTVAVGMVATLALAFLLPPTFRSTATILIEQQEIPQDLVRSTITSFADQRVQIISQRVMTTTNLLEIIRRYQLYPREQKTEPREALLQRMRGDIRMDMISADVIDPRSGRPTQATIAFSVSYQNRSPDLALKVANELTTLYLNENLTSRTQLAKDTATFLGQEAERISAEIDATEQKLATFKEQNVDRLPDLMQLNFQLMDRTELELREVDARLRSLDEQRVYLESQLAQISPTSAVFAQTGERIMSPADRLKALRTELASAEAVYAADHPDVLRIRREAEGLAREVGATDSANDLERRVLQARGELAAARERYAPDHPDVLRLERTVASLEEAASRAPAARAAPQAAPDNPAFIQIRAQLESAHNEQRSLERKRSELRAKIASFEARLAQSPQIEREYRELARDYENAQLKYREVRAKQMEAELSQNLESDRKGEKFTLIEPPLPPEEPVSPNRAVILVLGILLSLAAAVGVVAVRESLDGTIRGRHDVATLLDTPPLAVIPRIETRGEKQQRRQRLRYATVGAIGSVLIAAVAVHLLIRPLDVLWFTVLRRLGI